MKTGAYLFVVFFLVVNQAFSKAFRSADPNEVLAEMATAIESINRQYEVRKAIKESELAKIKANLKSAVNPQCQIELLVAKNSIEDALKLLQKETNNEISKIRYLKGLQVIKILYEKVLGLDHHFASVRTLNEINKISNPNQYPEYNKLKEVIASKREKKTAFDLTALLGANAIVSVVQTFTTMITSSLTRDEKEKELANVDCILDFTLRMQNDLNTIYFETAFLQTSNDKIKQDIEALFRDYTKPIGYVSSLEDCRKNDDWEAITQKMDEYISKMKTTSGTVQYKMQVNVEFPIDRLVQFIAQYNNFIDQGGKFYEKFKIILNSYENEKQCESKLPTEYKKLKSDIDVAILKFNSAYKPVEINGTKMKEILYGLNEFE